MKTAKIILWYLGVAAAVGILIWAFTAHSLILSLISIALTWVLKRTCKNVPIPRIYARMGITNDLFQGEGRHEKNH